MKRIILIFLAAVIVTHAAFASAAGHTASENPEAVPEDVAAYAENTVLPTAKGFMMNPENGFIGKTVENAEEIDNLTSGNIYQLWTESIPMTGEEELPELITCSNQWLFCIDGPDETAALAVIYYDNDGKLGHYGVSDGKNFRNAINIMEGLANKAGTEEKPRVIGGGMDYGHALALEFNGDMRVITVPSSAFELDPAYFRVSSYKELPTGNDYVKALKHEFDQASAGSEYVYGNSSPSLAPKLSAWKKLILPFTITLIAAAMIAGIFAATMPLRKRKLRAD